MTRAQRDHLPDLLNELGKLEGPVDLSEEATKDFSAYLNTDTANVANAVLTLINGAGNAQPSAAWASTSEASTQTQINNLEAVHYLCHDTGRIDGCGDNDNGGCPLDSKVTYFVLAQDIKNSPTIDTGYGFVSEIVT